MKKLNIWIWIILILSAITVLSVITWQIVKAKRLQRYAAEKPLRNWIALIYAAGNKAWMTKRNSSASDAKLRKIIAVGPPPEEGQRYYSDQRMLGWALESYEAALWFVQWRKDQAHRLAVVRKRVTRRLTRALQIGSLIEKLKELGEIYTDDARFLSEAKNQLLVDQLALTVLARIAELQALMHTTGTEKELVELTGLIDTYQEDLEFVYEYPAEWDDWVALVMENPILNDFRLVGKSPRKNEILLLGGEAIAERSLTKAKIVLAFCKDSDSMKSEVGSYLRGRLSEFVAEQHLLHHITDRALTESG